MNFEISSDIYIYLKILMFFNPLNVYIYKRCWNNCVNLLTGMYIVQFQNQNWRRLRKQLWNKASWLVLRCDTVYRRMRSWCFLYWICSSWINIFDRYQSWIGVTNLRYGGLKRGDICKVSTPMSSQLGFW